MNDNNEPINSLETSTPTLTTNTNVPSDLPSKGRELTSKNRAFLQHLTEGRTTLEAYKLAGYKGENHAAYQLRSDLKEELIRTLESQGVDRAGLMSEVKKLLDLPLRETEITIKHKLDLLKLLAKTLPSNQENKPQITAFVVNTTVQSNDPKPSIDSTLVD